MIPAHLVHLEKLVFNQVGEAPLKDLALDVKAPGQRGAIENGAPLVIDEQSQPEQHAGDLDAAIDHIGILCQLRWYGTILRHVENSFLVAESALRGMLDSIDVDHPCLSVSREHRESLCVVALWVLFMWLSSGCSPSAGSRFPAGSPRPIRGGVV